MSEIIKKTKKQSVSQLEIAREIAEQESLPLETITRIIELEQKLTMIYVKKGKRVVKKNYLTLIPIKRPAKTFHSKLTNKDYEIEESMAVKVAVGCGFKSFVNPKKKMKQKICRFVDSSKQKQIDE